jgi:DNA repair protein RadD
VSDALTAFLEDPLSEGPRGNSAARQFAIDVSESDRGIDEAINPESPTGQRRLVLKSQDALFSYQQEIVDGLHTWFCQQDNHRGTLVSLPTGAGKTRTAVWFARELATRQLARTVLWVAPSSELVEQAVGCIEDLWTRFAGAPSTELLINTFGDGNKSRQDLRVFVCTAQLAARRLETLADLNIDLLVFDEAHQAVARTFRQVISRVLESGKARAVGLSATPGRATEDESEDLRDLFKGQIITASELGKSPVEHLIQKGVLSALEVSLLPLPEHHEGSRVRSLDRRYLSLDDLALTAARFWAVVDVIESRPQTSKTLVFGASLAHCYALAGALHKKAESVAVVSHSTAPSRRKDILQRFAAGTIDVLLNKSLLATGYDCPSMSDVVLASPIRSPILWEQVLGRVSRGPSVGGTKVGRVWELDDHRAMHRQVLSYARFLGDLWS